MMLEEGMTPVFQPTTLRSNRAGLKQGSTVFHIHKILNGNFNIKTILKVGKETEAESLSMAIVSKIKGGGSCVLESFGKRPILISLSAIELARRKLIPERLDVAAALDPVVVELDGRDIDSTLMNRIVLLECGVRDPTNLRVKVNIRLR